LAVQHPLSLTVDEQVQVVGLLLEQMMVVVVHYVLEQVMVVEVHHDPNQTPLPYMAEHTI